MQAKLSRMVNATIDESGGIYLRLGSFPSSFHLYPGEALELVRLYVQTLTKEQWEYLQEIASEG